MKHPIIAINLASKFRAVRSGAAGAARAASLFCGIIVIGASLSEPHIDELVVEFVYIIYLLSIYFSYVVP